MAANRIGYDHRAWWVKVTANGIAPCHFASRGGCGGPLDAHHVIRKALIKQNVEKARRDAALMDERNGLAVCRNHHYDIHSVKQLKLREVPPRMWAFAKHYGLEWALEKQIETMQKDAA